MRITIETPTKAYISGATLEEMSSLRKYLSYTNVSTLMKYKKLVKNQWAKKRDPEGWAVECEELKKASFCSLVFEDDRGAYVRAGSIPYLIEQKLISPDSVGNNVKYPAYKPIPWAHMPKHSLYPYQKSTVDKLIEEKHGCAVLCTGAGKSLAMLTIARNMGLKTLIVTPSQSIFSEILEQCEHYFGKGMVGGFGDGKKVTNKKITVCISKSITMLKPDSEHFRNIRSVQVVLFDEAHTIGAESLDEICHGTLGDIPYRFFFTGTHTRGDGAVKLLESITGRVVEELSTKEAIEGGYICDHEFRIVKVKSDDSKHWVSDGIAMKRFHFLRNSNISDFIVKLATSVFISKNEKTLVLVDEVGQIASLIKKLKIPYAYAHSGANKKELEKLGLEVVDVQESIEKFNKGEVAILIGTGCIGTGVNMYPTHHCVNFQGGSSEVKTKQGAVGRGIRKLKGSDFEHLHPEKLKTIIWDFDVQDVKSMEDQLKNRIRYYKHSGKPIKEVG